MNENQTMFIKTATTSAVGYAMLGALPAAAPDLNFAWLAVGTPQTSVSHGLDYYGSYSGFLVFTDDHAPFQHAVVQCPGFHGHDFSQEGICTIIDKAGAQLFVKWQCSPVTPPDGMVSACAGEAEIIGGSAPYSSATSRGEFRAIVQKQHSDGSLSGYSEFGSDLLDAIDFASLIAY